MVLFVWMAVCIRDLLVLFSCVSVCFAFVAFGIWYSVFSFVVPVVFVLLSPFLVFNDVIVCVQFAFRCLVLSLLA